VRFTTTLIPGAAFLSIGAHGAPHPAALPKVVSQSHRFTEGGGNRKQHGVPGILLPTGITRGAVRRFAFPSPCGWTD